MNILIVGEPFRVEEARAKFGNDHQYSLAESQLAGRKLFGKTDVVFDFIIHEDPSQLEAYRDRKGLPVFLNTPSTTLAQIVTPISDEIDCFIFGFNGLPTFLTRSVLEVSLLRKEDLPQLANICQKLKTEFLEVEDSAGMVTPRVICMIINEAYLAVQDGTASREDIDLAMKLGTNYPFGPIEWSKKIGLKNVCEVLDAMYNEFKDERFRACDLLVDEAKAV